MTTGAAASARNFNFYSETIIDRLKAVLPPIRDAVPWLKHKGAGELAGPCPLCGGTDRFYVRADGSFACRRCNPRGGGDIVDFHCWLKGVDIFSLADVWLADRLREDTERPKAPATSENLKKVYSYVDEVGAELFQVCRYEADGCEKTFRQRHRSGDGFVWNLKGIRRVLYRLPEVIAADLVLLVEGEKDVDNLAALGLAATTSPMGASNWKSEYSEVLQGKHVAILPDNDGPGQKYLDAVLSSLKGVAASVKVVRVPVGKDTTDWIQSGATKEDIQGAIDAAGEYQADHAEVGGNDWPEPEPLTSTIDPQPYPIDALPGLIRDAVEEVQAFVQAPLPLVASSALSAVSLACQGFVDVERAAGLSGPSSIFLLSIADSGERKSQIDKQFFSGISAWVERQIEAAKPMQAEFHSRLAVWEVKKAAILEQIKKDTKAGKSTGELEAKLEKLQKSEPMPPRVPRMIVKDDTPEALAGSLGEKWPTAGVISSEGGTVFGSHGMSQDSMMRNLSQLNVLWDGGVLDMGRKTSASVHVSGARLTMGIQIQEPTLRAFFEGARGLPRGTGFLARFLFAWPGSTMGGRFFKDAPEEWPALTRFNGQILQLLESPLPWDASGACSLNPTMLKLSADAKAAWAGYHDTIERELRRGGELEAIKDIAAKSADNAARLAALFHLFNRVGGEITTEEVNRGARVAVWHLSESMRFFGGICLPEELANAQTLDTWLIEHCRAEKTQEVSTKKILQFGPNALRSADKITAAVQELSDLGRARLVQEGKKKLVQINPKLLQGVPK